MENPIKKRLQLADESSSSVQQQQDTDSSNAQKISGDSDVPTMTSAQSTLPADIPSHPTPPDPFSFDWSYASQFFNSKEAENFSLYALEPNLFESQNTFDYNFEPTMNMPLSEMSGPYFGPPW